LIVVVDIVKGRRERAMLRKIGDMQVAGSLGFGGELSGWGRYLMDQLVTAVSDHEFVDEDDCVSGPDIEIESDI
jgi:regulator of RNase E activity RraB